MDAERVKFDKYVQQLVVKTSIARLDQTVGRVTVPSVAARLNEAHVAEDVERIVLEELQRWYGRRHFGTLDRDRLADATIAICTAWNRFLEELAP